MTQDIYSIVLAAARAPVDDKLVIAIIATIKCNVDDRYMINISCKLLRFVLLFSDDAYVSGFACPCP